MLEIGLSYLHEAASLGSMRLASDRLGVAVSTISRQIAQLEREFGLPLFERGRRTIQLTAAGRIAVEFHRSRVADLEALFNRLRELQDSRVGEVTLAVGEGFLGKVFSEAIGEFQRQYPGVIVTLLTGSSSDVMELVAEDAAHIGLAFNPEIHPRVRSRASVSQPLMLICSPDHPAAREREISFADLSRYQLGLPPRGYRIREALEEALSREHVRLQIQLVSASIQGLRGAAHYGGLPTLLPPIALLSDLEDEELVALPIRGQLTDTRIELIHRLGRRLDGAPGRLLALLDAKVRSWGVVSN